MKLKDRKEFLWLIAVSTAVICLVILLFFKTGIFTGALKSLISLLMPFIYGAVIAYLLRPVCLFFERLLIRLFDRKGTGKRKGLCRALSIVIGIGLGALMGSAIHFLNVPPFITTLTGNFLARGVCSLISRESISIDHPQLNSLSDIKITLYHLVDGQWEKIKPVTNINLNVIIFIVMIILGTIVLQHTRFGRNVYAVGGSEQSAKLMGLPVGKTKVAVYAINGFCSALCGITYLLTVKSGWNMALQGGELEVISCAVIGGTLLTGGVGYMIGTMFGVLLKSVIPSLISFNGALSSWWGKIATGALLLLFIVIQRIVVSGSTSGLAKKLKHK